MTSPSLRIICLRLRLPSAFSAKLHVPEVGHGFGLLLLLLVKVKSVLKVKLNWLNQDDTSTPSKLTPVLPVLRTHVLDNLVASNYSREGPESLLHPLMLMDNSIAADKYIALIIVLQFIG